jgi:predicted pyridoxine 5'-phosphate oxidase superfamily flavin-nucleotide-binding protein
MTKRAEECKFFPLARLFFLSTVELSGTPGFSGRLYDVVPALGYRIALFESY